MLRCRLDVCSSAALLVSQVTSFDSELSLALALQRVHKCTPDQALNRVDLYPGQALPGPQGSAFVDWPAGRMRRR